MTAVELFAKSGHTRLPVYEKSLDKIVGVAHATEILNTVAMHANEKYPIRSTIAAAGGQLFIRMNAKLYCVGKK